MALTLQDLQNDSSYIGKVFFTIPTNPGELPHALLVTYLGEINFTYHPYLSINSNDDVQITTAQFIDQNNDNAEFYKTSLPLHVSRIIQNMPPTTWYFPGS